MSLFDPALSRLLTAEEHRQKVGLEMIPSENYASAAVLAAMGTVFTNKYAEGYPNRRYYGGNEVVDQMELLTIERARQLFPEAEHINVQPYSGSPANAAIYFGTLEYGDTVLGLKLDHGGHITHGLPISFSGKSYRFIPYGVNLQTGRIDMDEVAALAREHRPKMIVAGITAYTRILDFVAFAQIAQAVGAILMADISHIAGLVVGGVHPSPLPHCDIVMTTTHKTLRGPRGAIILCKEQYASGIDRAVFPGFQGGPHENMIFAKAVAFAEAARPEFTQYAHTVVANAKKLAESLLQEGFSLISGGTDNHMVLVDLTNKQITGKQMQTACDAVGITLNKNTIPGDTRSPFDPSGVRLGTPALTTRGMMPEHMPRIAGWLRRTAEHANDSAQLARIKAEIAEFAGAFPLPGIDDFKLA